MVANRGVKVRWKKGGWEDGEDDEAKQAIAGSAARN
jgi:hypothetical protein